MPIIKTIRPHETNGHAAVVLPVPCVNSYVGPPRIAGNMVIKIISPTPPVLGDEAYYGLVGEFLRAVEPYTEAMPAAILAQLLPAVGTLVGPGPYIWAGNKQYARIFSVVVGPTNCGRKGTALGPIDCLMELVDDQFWRRQRVGGLSSGEGLIQKVSDIVERDGEGNERVKEVEKRVFAVEEEFSRALANIRREGNILSQVMREAFDSGNLGTLTVNPRHAFGSHICVVGHITPEELAERFDHIEMANGFGNRFMWFYVKSDKLLPHPTPIPDKVYQAVAPRLRAISKLKNRSLELAPSAMELWEEVYPRLREDQPGLVGAVTARGSAIVLRLSLIYSLLDGKLKGIERQHLEAALAVWRYSAESAHILFQSETGDKFCDKIVKLLSSGPMTRDEFNDHLSKTQKGKLGGALDRLAAGNFIHKMVVKHKGAGRPSERWELT